MGRDLPRITQERFKMKARKRANQLRVGQPLYMALFDALVTPTTQSADSALSVPFDPVPNSTSAEASIDAPSDVPASSTYTPTPLNMPQKWCGRLAPVARSALNTKLAPQRSLSVRVTRRHSETRRRRNGKRRGLIGTSCLLQEGLIYEELQVCVHGIEDSAEATYTVTASSPVKELVPALTAAHVRPRWDRAVRGLTMGGSVLNEQATWADQGVESNAQLIWRPLNPEEVEAAQEDAQCDETADAADSQLTGCSQEALIQAWGRRRGRVDVASAQPVA